MKKSYIFLAIALGPIFTFGQETIVKRNTVYFEAFGQGLYNSFSYDRLYRTDKKIKTSITAGLTLIPTKELFVLGAPISYNFLFGQKNHHLELGVGFTILRINMGKIDYTESYPNNQGVEVTNTFIGSETDYYSYFTPKIGYRFQKPNGGMFFRVTLTPPVAGINRIGSINESKYYHHVSNQYFYSAPFFEPYKIYPWAGLSIGYTLK